MSDRLDDYQRKLEGMVAESAADIADLQNRCGSLCEHRELEALRLEFNGLCLALRAIDEELYEAVDFNDSEWIEQHRADIYPGGQA